MDAPPKYQDVHLKLRKVFRDYSPQVTPKSIDEAVIEFYDTPAAKNKRIAQALDAVNNKYGEFVIIPALMMDLDEKVVDRIAFGGVRDLLTG